MITHGVTKSRITTIDVEWADRRLAKVCAADGSGERHYGKERWQLLRRRLAALLAAPTLVDLDDAPGRCHALTADRAGQFAMNLWGPYRLVFEPVTPTALLKDGGIDRRAVTAIKVLEIVDYHDQ